MSWSLVRIQYSPPIYRGFMFNFLCDLLILAIYKLYLFTDRVRMLYNEKKLEFKDYIKTDVTFVNPAVAREQSIKASYPGTYDRYTAVDKNGELKYHYPVKEKEGN